MLATSLCVPFLSAGSYRRKLLKASHCDVLVVYRALLKQANAPMTQAMLDGHLLAQIHSEEELQKILAANPRNLVVLMCKAMSCRPCKVPPVFARLLLAPQPSCLSALPAKAQLNLVQQHVLSIACLYERLQLGEVLFAGLHQEVSTASRAVFWLCLPGHLRR